MITHRIPRRDPPRATSRYLALVPLALLAAFASACSGCGKNVDKEPDAAAVPVPTADLPPAPKDAADRLRYIDAIHGQPSDSFAFKSEEKGHFTASNPAIGLAPEVASGAFSIRPLAGRTRWVTTLKPARMGYTGALGPVPPAADVAQPKPNRLELLHPGLNESVVNGPLGIAYGFALTAPKGFGEGTTQFLLELSAAGELTPSVSFDSRGRSAQLATASGEPVLVARDLFAVTSAGVSCPVAFSIADKKLLIRLDDKGAAYPIKVSMLLTIANELTASDASGDDGFGDSVAVTAATLVVGAPTKGAAYTFSRAGGSWRWQSKLFAAEAAKAQADFGAAVAAEGDTLVVGAPRSAKPGYAGAVYVYSRKVDSWELRATLAPPEGAGLFGAQVAISDGLIAVGAPGAPGPKPGAGSVYTYALTAGKWADAGRVAPEGPASPRFGRTLAFGSGVLLAASGDGSAAVFTRGNSNTWSPSGRITQADAGETFGDALALAGDTVFVGAPGKGSVYAYTRAGAAWTLRRTFAGEPKSGFGAAVASNGSVLAIGSPMQQLAGLGVGGVSMFAKRGKDWFDSTRLVSAEGKNGDGFGDAVAFSGDMLIVGTKVAPKCPPDCTPRPGRAYSFPRQAAKPDGQKCGDDGECTSGSCADGVCCNERCDGACESCLAAQKRGGGGPDGTCAPVAASTDPRNKCAADPDHYRSCGADGMCDGAGKCRTVAPAGAECSPATCTNGAIRRSSCDGTAGGCRGGFLSCGGFACSPSGNECLTSCAQDGDCVGNTTCVAGVCRKRK